MSRRRPQWRALGIACAVALAAGGTHAAWLTLAGADAGGPDPYVASPWAIGRRPLADRHGRVVAVTTDDGGRAQRTVIGPASAASELLVRLVDMNYPSEVASSTRRGLFGDETLEPLRLSVDWKIQEAAATALGNATGVAVALDPRTGEVLALAANLPDVERLPAWAPGSVFKLVTYSDAAQRAQIDDSSRFPSERSYRGVANAGTDACGGTVVDVLAYSCNTAAIRTGERLDTVALRDAAARFGFSDVPPLRGVEPSTTGMPSDPGVSASPLTLIGQLDVRMNPLTGAQLAATIATGGTRPGIRLLPGTSDSTVVVGRDAAALVNRALVAAVVRGTASAAAIDEVGVAAKTGTAQAADGSTNAWTVAYAPTESPRVAVAVVVLGKPGEPVGGGTTAAPISRQIIEAALMAIAERAFR